MTVKQTLRLAFSGPVVRRALFFGVVVGVILNAINHFECCILNGMYSHGCVIRAILTASVPYLVSTVSSVLALRDIQARQS